MKFINIPSTDLPEINAFVKECVNKGQWTLFRAEKADSSDCKIEYYLKADKDFFALNENGKVISVFQSVHEGFQMNEVVHFSDVPKPESLSNLASLQHARAM
ncbi:hypothetical protein [Pantoea sp. S18]|uniref:hypothetical protein n=1 Tax=Pantoea sp. S18 TaxID=3019892 RepID=UPI002B2161CA|nr:hypothetical protein [Pantoea sp. S18]MEA5105175.1 hypothetical protein [Pantoea sp. S18]